MRIRPSPRPLPLLGGTVLAGMLLASSVAHSEKEDDPAERAAFIRSHYAKYEHRIPMRDGRRLFTAVYVPQHVDQAPILLTRTPYAVNPYGSDRFPDRLGPTAAWEKNGYVFVFQDVRGRFMSEGDFVDMRPHRSERSAPPRSGRSGPIDEATDTWDTIEWLLEHVPGHNGRVGMKGISYPGFYTSAGAIDGHPALEAVSPQAPIADWFWDDMHHHGAFVLPLAFNFFSVFGVEREGLGTEWPERFDHGTPDGYQFFLDLGPLSNANARYLKGEIPFWNELTRHPNYDAFWQARNILPHLRRVKAATLVVGGWFDTEDLYGPLKTFRSIRDQNPGTPVHLVMGPWSHGAWAGGDGRRLGEADFGFPTAEPFRERVELPFFEHHLRDGPDPQIPRARLFETGADRWRSFAAWPPEELEPRSLYLREGGALAETPPAVEGQDGFVSDPAKPVPYTMEITTRWAKKHMTEDQRFAAWRPDVLVYRSGPLEEDVTLAGPLFAELWVSTDQGDADWVVKLVDEHPGRPYGKTKGRAETGRVQRLVRAEVLRGRFRESYTVPKPFEPGEPTLVAFELQDVLHTFRRGHRIVVHVQSSWFPFIDRNPQRWVDNIFEAEAEDFVVAHHTVFRSPNRPSRLRVGVLPRADGFPIRISAPPGPTVPAGPSMRDGPSSEGGGG